MISYIIGTIIIVGCVIFAIAVYVSYKKEEKYEKGSYCLGLFISSMIMLGVLGISIKCVIDQDKDNIIKALNNELKYDTISLDKNGKLLDIKLK